MDGLINTVEQVQRQFGTSARIYVDGFELDANGRPITLPWQTVENTWLKKRLTIVREDKTQD